MSATLFARPLEPGGTIGVAAPASPYDARSEIFRGVEWWERRPGNLHIVHGDRPAPDERRSLQGSGLHCLRFRRCLARTLLGLRHAS